MRPPLRARYADFFAVADFLSAARFSAQRFLVAAMIRAIPSGLICRFAFGFSVFGATGGVTAAASPGHPRLADCPKISVRHKPSSQRCPPYGVISKTSPQLDPPQVFPPLKVAP